MNKRREVFETKFIGYIKKVGLDKRNVALYEKQFASLSDEEFHAMVETIQAGTFVLPVFSFNMSDNKLNLQTIMKVGESLGIKWFNRLRLTDHLTGETYLTGPEYLVLQLEVRRQIQHLIKKRATATDNKHVDQLSGQVTGVSKAASMTLPEITALSGKGLEQSIIEMIKVNGGDSKAYADMVRQLQETGGFSLEPILNLGSRVKSIDTTNAFLKGMMFESNL